MRPLACLVALASTLLADGPAPDPVHVALDKIAEAAAKSDWPAESAARRELIALGEPAVRVLSRELDEMEDARLRRACYEVLGESFAKDERTGPLLARALLDEDEPIRYQAAFRLGDLKAYASHRQLQRFMDDAKTPAFLRLTAAKSLAQLGETSGLRLLAEGAVADSYMERMMGNVGLKALSGKALGDFEGYEFGEGAYVSGGNEMMVPFDALAAAEKKARRFAVAAAYFRWLKADRPDLYKHLTGAF